MTVSLRDDGRTAVWTSDDGTLSAVAVGGSPQAALANLVEELGRRVSVSATEEAAA